MIEDEGDNPSQVKLLYVLEYRDGFVLVTDHTRVLRNILKEYEKFEPKRYRFSGACRASP